MGLGKVGTCARYLGAQLAAPGKYKSELACRLKAITIGWSRLGSFWTTESSYKMKRLCFISNVQSAGLSAGHVVPYLKSEADQLDNRLCKFLRVAMMGKAHSVEVTCERTWTPMHLLPYEYPGPTWPADVPKPTGPRLTKTVWTHKHHSMTNEQVFMFWKIAPCVIEFRIRRIRMWQSFLRQPTQHVQVNAAMFGKLIFEAEPLDHQGKTTPETHSFLRMLEIDIKVLSDNIDDGASLFEYITHRQGIRTLIHDFEAREMFIAIDPAQMRARYFSVSIPPPGYVAPSTITAAAMSSEPEPGPISERSITHPWLCNMSLQEGIRCPCSFESARALTQHIVHTGDGYHSLRNYARFLTLTSQCIHCRSTFKSTFAAQQHTQSAEIHGMCPTSRSMYETLIPIKDMHCILCNHIAANHNCLQTHLETHSLNPPSTFAVPQHRRHDLREGPPAEHAEAPGKPTCKGTSTTQESQ